MPPRHHFLVVSCETFLRELLHHHHLMIAEHAHELWMVHHGLNHLIGTRPSVNEVTKKDHHVLCRQRKLFEQPLEGKVETVNISYDPNTMAIIKRFLEALFQRSVPKYTFFLHAKKNTFDCI